LAVRVGKSPRGEPHDTAIVTRGLAKTFSTKIKELGLAGSLKAIFKPEFQDIQVVRGIDLRVKKGEVIAL